MAPLLTNDVQKLIQTVTLAVLGIDPLTDPNAYKKVRVGWQQQGQPAWGMAEDVTIVRATEQDDDRVNRVRDESFSTYSTTQLNDTFTYIRVWKVFWTLYGPNSFDNARKIKSAIFQQVFHDQLAIGGLCAVMDPPSPNRVPELFQGQWWDRVDFYCLFNEGVTETPSQVNAIASAEVIVEEGVNGANVIVADKVFPPA